MSAIIIIVMRNYITTSSFTSSLSDQYAIIRLTGSTTATAISLIHTVIQMLDKNSYVRVIATDFSKKKHSILSDTYTAGKKWLAYS